MCEEIVSKIDDAYTVRRLEEMISIPSVVGDEGALAEYLREELDSLGFKAELNEVEPNRYNVYGRIHGNGSGQRLMFNGHTDTVPVCEGWVTDPFKPVRKKELVYGLGSCDMKGGFSLRVDCAQSVG
jgi:acetylornithine deacetylase